MQRRQVLALAATVPLAGCGGMPQDALVNAEPVSSAPAPTDVAYADLPPAEQRIVETAIREPYYHTCPEIPDTVYDFANRLKSQEPYLEYDDTRYGLCVTVTDQGYASTAYCPVDTPDCGGF
ncbi:hypothetical protein [Halorubellus salinus]|uniref:hypothetical protein n=1 Tax=Halorubellus salinus TaxID=755309 RepID=UPI001D06670A|nr:hypothetical protein [Halorubellus salinus]